MDINLIIIFICLIPITAIIDYFAFRNRFKQINIIIKWHYYFIPCALELGFFICGFILGGIYGI